jgi:hypothetical protein
MELANLEDVVTLGFDVRERIGERSAGAWSEERRSRFLIRPEVRYPLSVDRSVWPQASGRRNEEAPLYVWGSVAEILVAFPGVLSKRPTSPIVIEIAVLATGHSAQRWRDLFQGVLRPERDSALEVGFQEYGYDVADRSLLSGLSNCMLSSEELESLRTTWKGSVNSLGLFSEVGEAAKYSGVCDSLIPEHAPFSAYRIRRVAVRAP